MLSNVTRPLAESIARLTVASGLGPYNEQLWIVEGVAWHFGENANISDNSNFVSEVDEDQVRAGIDYHYRAYA